MASRPIDSFAVIYNIDGDLEFFKKMKAATNEANDAVKQSFAERALPALTAIGTVGSAALGILGKAGIDADQQFRRLQARIKATDGEIQQLRDSAFQIAGQLPLNVLDIARAQTAYGALGKSVKDIIADMPTIAQASVATGASLEALSRHAAVGANIFGVTVGEILDKMIAIENSSAATAVEIGAGFQRSAKTAQLAGLSLDQYLAIVGALAGTGQSASQASRAINDTIARTSRALENVGESVKVVRESYAALGIDINELQQILRNSENPWLDLLQRISESTASNTVKVAAFSTLAGTTYGSALAAVVGSMDEVLQNVEVSMNSAGEAANQVDTIMGGAYGSTARLAAQVDLVRNRLGEAGLLSVVERITGAFGWLVGLLAQTEGTAGDVAGAFRWLIRVGVVLAASMLGFAAAVKIAQGVSWTWSRLMDIINRIRRVGAVEETKETTAKEANTAATNRNTAAALRQAFAKEQAAVATQQAVFATTRDTASTTASAMATDRDTVAQTANRLATMQAAATKRLGATAQDRLTQAAITGTYAQDRLAVAALRGARAGDINAASQYRLAAASETGARYASMQNMTQLRLNTASAVGQTANMGLVASTRARTVSTAADTPVTLANTTAVSAQAVAVTRLSAAQRVGALAAAPFAAGIRLITGAFAASPLGAALLALNLIATVSFVIATYWRDIWGFIKGVVSTIGGFLGFGGGGGATGTPPPPRGGSGPFGALTAPLPTAPPGLGAAVLGAGGTSLVLNGDIRVDTGGSGDPGVIAGGIVDSLDQRLRQRDQSITDSLDSRELR